jgi:hypothetical protein
VDHFTSPLRCFPHRNKFHNGLLLQKPDYP